MKQDMGFLDLIYVVAKHKTLVIIITVLFAIGAIVYSLVTPEYWKSRATLLPISDTGMLGSFSSNIMDVLSGGSLLKVQKSELAKEFITIMQSRSFRIPVMEKFDLINYLKVKGKDEAQKRDKALRLIAQDVVKLSFDLESNLVVIEAETKDKDFSKQIADYYVAALQKYLTENKMSKGKQKRIFLESQVAYNQAQFDSLSNEIREFQKKYKAISLDKQTESLVAIYSENVAELFKADIELELAKIQYNETSPVVQELGSKRKLLEQKIKDMESSKLVPDYIINIDKIPDLSMRYAQLMLNAEIRKQVFQLIYPQYELAKLEEVKDMPAFEIIDAPDVAGLRSKPKRALIVVLVTIAAFMLSCLIALIKENVFINNRERIDQIKNALKAKKKNQE